MENQNERRKFSRLNILVDVTYAKHADSKKRGKLTLTKNIGKGGICFVGYEKLKIGDVIDLKVYLPGDNASIVAIAKVNWVKEFTIGDTDSKRYDVGVEFIDIGEVDVKRVDNYVQTHIT